jgi:hypothetical protein
MNFDKFLRSILMALPLVSVSWADEWVGNRSDFEKLGFQVEGVKALKDPIQRLFSEPLLSWPIQFESPEYSLGNVMAQYQDYGSGAYFHGGLDLRGQDGGEIVAPVSGRIEAGHYGYERQVDGSMKKWWRAWPNTGPDLYFEVAIVRDDGVRFEIHHIDRSTLTTEVIQALKNQGRIAAGTKLGGIHHWPMAGAGGRLYHHVHYNIIDPSGRSLNPEAWSVPILVDQTPPTIHRVVAQKSGRVFEIAKNDLVDGVDTFYVVTTDQRASNVYIHMPSRVALMGASGVLTEWNFRNQLRTSQDSWPDIRQVFAERLRLSSGEVITTEGNYNENIFIVQLKVPVGSKAQSILVQDQKGNSSTFELKSIP